MSLCFLLYIAPAFIGLRGDMHYVYSYGKIGLQIVEGKVPYRDFFYEYPPMSAVLMGLIGLIHLCFRNQDIFFGVFVGAMLVFDMLQKKLLWNILPKKRQLLFLLIYTLASSGLSYTYLKRFDIAVACFTTYLLVRFVEDPSGLWSWFLLALAVLFKIYPLFFAPLMLLYGYNRQVGEKRLLSQLGVCAATFGSIMLGLYLWLKEDGLMWVHYHHDRGIHGTSSYAALASLLSGCRKKFQIKMAFGSTQVNESWADAWVPYSSWLMLTVVVVTCLVLYKSLRTPVAFWQACCAIVLAILTTSKVFSPQFMVWLIPLIMVSALTPKRIDIWLLCGLVVSVALTGNTFPGENRMLLEGVFHKQLSLVARTLVLFAMWLYLLLKPYSLSFKPLLTMRIFHR